MFSGRFILIVDCASPRTTLAAAATSVTLGSKLATSRVQAREDMQLLERLGAVKGYMSLLRCSLISIRIVLSFITSSRILNKVTIPKPYTIDLASPEFLSRQGNIYNPI